MPAWSQRPTATPSRTPACPTSSARKSPRSPTRSPRGAGSPSILVGDPTQQVGIDACQEAVQRRFVEGAVVVHPAPHDGIDLSCEVGEGSTGAVMQPPGPHLCADFP